MTYKKIIFMTICLGCFLSGGLISSLLELKLNLAAEKPSFQPTVEASIVSKIDAVPMVSVLTTAEKMAAVEQPLPLKDPGQQVAAPAANPQEIALFDKEKRFSEEFAIPAGLENRVAFWLDVYTKYDSKNYIVHHKEYPWLVFDVVDTTPLFLIKRNAKWLNRADADKTAERRKNAVLAALKKLSKRTNFENLTPDEAHAFDVLKTVSGPRKKVIREALESIRIQLGQKDMFEMGLMRSSPFIPLMEQVFESHGLPKELVRIPLVESSFNLEAHSRVGARGVWQIMPGVGKTGMIINDSIDERQSPLKSTYFAAKMLRQNHRSLKEWPLAVTAYNHGTGSLLKAVRLLKTYNLQKIIERNSSKSFQFASSNFYACFLAALRGERYSAELFPNMNRPQGLSVVKLTLQKSLSIGMLAKKVGLELADLQSINPDLPENLKASFSLPAGFQIYVPHEKTKDLKAVQGLTQKTYLAAGQPANPAM